MTSMKMPSLEHLDLDSAQPAANSGRGGTWKNDKQNRE